MDFDRLVLVKRADAAQRTPRPRVRGEAGTFVGNDVVGFLNGLPINFQGNGYLREIAIDNEIAVLSPIRPDGQLTTLYRPEQPVYVGDLKLHFDADRLLFSSVGSHDRWQIFEIGSRRQAPAAGDARRRTTTSTTTTPVTCPTTGSSSPRRPVSSRSRASGGATRWPTSA